MENIMPKIRVDLMSLVWVMLIMYFKSEWIIPCTIAIVIHELGHILISVFLKIKIKCIRTSILGARLEMEGDISYLDEMLIAFAGPFFGFCAFLFTIYFAHNSQEVMTFSIISLSLSMFNLFPIDTLDGGRILKCLIFYHFSIHKAERIMQIISFFTLFFFWLISVYIMIKFSSGLSTFVFCAILFSKCFIFNIKKRDFESF
jgi:Zn-dependent protease